MLTAMAVVLGPPAVMTSQPAAAAPPRQPAAQPAGIAAATATSSGRHRRARSAPQRRVRPASQRRDRRRRLVRADRNRSLAREIIERRWDDPGQYRCLDRLWTRESGWNHRSRNPRSGAYGIPQALPGGKMSSAGGDWRTNPRTQIRWGLRYIKKRYGTPCRAWEYFRSAGWY